MYSMIAPFSGALRTLSASVLLSLPPFMPHASSPLFSSPSLLVSELCSTLEVEAVRRDQFAEFAKAVQVGLLDFQGPQGVKAFFSLMRSRYGQVR